MKKLRKTFIVSIMTAMVLSMSVVVAPEAQAASAGDVVKLATNSAVYFLGSDGLRHVFPNEATYFTWYSDFSNVQIVSQSELEEFSRGSNVTVRPGTKLITSPDETTVYAVESDSTLRSIVSEENAIALYGEDWATMVVDIVPSFMSNYTTGSALAEGEYPEGSLIKTADNPDVYYIDGAGLARKFLDGAAFLANNFKWDDIIETSMAIPTEGDMINGEETALSEVVSGAGTGAVVDAGSGLTVALSGDTPASLSIPSNGTLVSFLKVNLTASADGDVEVDNITFTRSGTGPTADFDGGYLFEDDERLTTKKSVNSSSHELAFSGLNYVVPAGKTKILTLKMSGTGSSNTGNHAFDILSADDVTTNGATVSGSFPVSGNTMSFAAVDAATVTLTSSDDLPNVKVGEADVKILEFDMENDSQEEVYVYSVTLKQNGTASDDAINNLSLDLDGTVVAEGVSMEGKYVTFTLSEPFKIKKSKKITATVRGDIITGVTKTVQLYLKNVADIDVRGSAYGDYYSATITNTSLNTTNADNITINGSEINVSFDGPVASDVKDNTTDVVLANFKVQTASEDVDIDTMRVVVTMASSTTAGDILDNVEMVDDANNVSYTVADLTAFSSGADCHYDFTDVSLEAGVQYNFEIRGDVPDPTSVGQTYVAAITFTSNFTASYVQSDESVTAATDISSASLTGKTMTVAAPSVTLEKITTNNATYVENTDKVLLYKGKITASAADDLKVSKMSFGTTFTTIDSIDDSFEKLYLYTADDDLGTPLDTEASLTDATYVTFSGFSLDIPAGTSNGVTVVVRGDTKNNPTAGAMAMRWGTGSATTTRFTIKDTDNDALGAGSYTSYTTDGQTSTIAALGTFTMAVDTTYSGLNTNQNVLAGEEALVGRLKLTAANEAATIEDFTIINVNGNATADDIAELAIYSDAAMTNKLGSATLDSSKAATFSDINVDVPISGITYWYVGASVNAIDYSASPGANSTASSSRTFLVDIGSTTAAYSVKALGKETGTQMLNNGVSSTTASNTSTITGAKITSVVSDFADGLLANGTARDIFSFKVTVPDSDNIDSDGTALGAKIDKISFTVASSADVALATFKLERVGGTNGEKDAKIAVGPATTATTSQFEIGVNATYASGTQEDLIIRPGTTAEYVVRATISGVGANDSLQVSIESMTSNFNYAHNTGEAGTDMSDVSSIYTLLPGVSYVRGGVLTN